MPTPAHWWSFGPIFHQLLTWLVFNTQKKSWLGLLSQTRKNNIKVAITKLSHFFVDETHHFGPDEIPFTWLTESSGPAAAVEEATLPPATGRVVDRPENRCREG